MNGKITSTARLGIELGGKVEIRWWGVAECEFSRMSCTFGDTQYTRTYLGLVIWNKSRGELRVMRGLILTAKGGIWIRTWQMVQPLRAFFSGCSTISRIIRTRMENKQHTSYFRLSEATWRRAAVRLVISQFPFSLLFFSFWMERVLTSRAYLSRHLNASQLE